MRRFKKMTAITLIAAMMFSNVATPTEMQEVNAAASYKKITPTVAKNGTTTYSKKPIKVTFKSSKIASVKVNKKKIKSGKKYSANKKYTIAFETKGGDKGSMTCIVDTKVPTIKSTKKGSSVVYTVKDTNLDYVVVGTKKYRAKGKSSKKITVKKTGGYVVKAVDLAGNVKTLQVKANSTTTATTGTEQTTGESTTEVATTEVPKVEIIDTVTEGKTVTKDGFTYALINNDTELKVKSCVTISDSVVIPASVEVEGKQLPVTVIGSSLHLGTATQVTMPESIKLIERGAFAGTQIKDLTIPASVETIGEMAFYNCTSLQNITFADGAKLKYVAKGAFSKCEATSITFPNGTLYLDDEVFQGSKITNIVLPDSVYYLGKSVFESCTCSGTLTLPASLTVIKEYAFESGSFADIILPDSVSTIERYAFYSTKCSELSLPKSLKSLGNHAFYCSTNSEIDLSKVTELTEISESAFRSMKTGDLVLPDCVEKIGKSAFMSITAGNVVLPAGLKEMGEYSFQGIKTDKVDVSKVVSLKKIPAGAFYAAKCYNIGIPDCVEVIGEDAFAESYVRTIVLPANLKELDAAFYGCDMLQTVDTSKVTKLSTIGVGAFQQCKVLKSFVIPDCVEVIESSAFLNSALTELQLGAGLETIGSSAFSGSRALSNVDTSRATKLKSIVAGAFSGCTALTNFDFPDSVVYIGNGAFRCSGLTSVKLPAGITLVDGSAFAGCASLTRIDATNAKNMSSFASDALYDTPVQNANKDAVSDIFNSKVVDVSTDSTETTTGTEATTGTETTTGTEATTGTGATTETVTTEDATPKNGDSRTDGYFHYVVTDNGNGAEVTIQDDVPEDMTELVIPDTVVIKGTVVPVTSVGPTEVSLDNVEKIVIGSNVTEIQDGAFSGCENLKEVDATRAENLQRVEDNAFKDCVNLEKFEVSEAVKETIEIGTTTFEGCDKLVSDVVDKAGNLTPKEDDGTSEEDTAVKDGDYHAENGFEYTVIGNGTGVQVKVEELPDGTTKLVLPDSVIIKGEELPVTVVGPSDSTVLDGVTDIVLGTNITEIKDGAFNDCETLERVDASKSEDLEKIEDGAFESCPNLGEFEINDSVKDTIEVGSGAFIGSDKLESEVLDRVGTLTTEATTQTGSSTNTEATTEVSTTESQFKDGDVFVEDNFEYTIVGNGTGVEISIAEKLPEGTKEWVVPDTVVIDGVELPVVSIGASDKTVLNGIEKVVIGSNVTSVEEGAFAGCGSLVEVDATKADKLEQIESGAFEGCSDLEKFETNEAVKDTVAVDKNAFIGCAKLDSAITDRVGTLTTQVTTQTNTTEKTTEKTTEQGETTTTTTEQQTTGKTTKMKTVYYKTSIKLSFDTSKIKTLKVNGKVVKSGKRLKKNGKYAIEFTDIKGNKTTCTYVIDTKKPTIKVKRKSSKKLKVTVKDTNLKSVIIKGKKYKVKKGTSIITLTKKGKYVVKATDKAGNVKKMTIRVK